MGLHPIDLGFPKITIYKGLPNNMLCKHKPCLSFLVIIKGKSVLFVVIKLWPVTGSSTRIFFPVTFFSYPWMFGHQIVQELRDVWHSCLRALNKILFEQQPVLGIEKNSFFSLFLYSPWSTFRAYSLHAHKVMFMHPSCPALLDTGQGILHLFIKYGLCVHLF